MKNKDLYAPVSFGELIDKITILFLKYEALEKRIAAGEDLVKQKENVYHEMSILKEIYHKHVEEMKIADPNPTKWAGLENRVAELHDINFRIWKIEDNIREKERKKEFDNEFIQLARAVYLTNDNRASVKRKINETFESDIVEVKSYKEYQ